MTNTIELLESIGANATLRHASAEQLADALSGLEASSALLRAAATGERASLSDDLGLMGDPERPQMQTQGGFEDGDDDDCDGGGDGGDEGGAEDGDSGKSRKTAS